jgi:hypothetical protein
VILVDSLKWVLVYKFICVAGDPLCLFQSLLFGRRIKAAVVQEHGGELLQESRQEHDPTLYVKFEHKRTFMCDIVRSGQF